MGKSRNRMKAGKANGRPPKKQAAFGGRTKKAADGEAKDQSAAPADGKELPVDPAEIKELLADPEYEYEPVDDDNESSDGYGIDMYDEDEDLTECVDSDYEGLFDDALDNNI